jgi:hypothetical protein
VEALTKGGPPKKMVPLPESETLLDRIVTYRNSVTTV